MRYSKQLIVLITQCSYYLGIWFMFVRFFIDGQDTIRNSLVYHTPLEPANGLKPALHKVLRVACYLTSLGFLQLNRMFN